MPLPRRAGALRRHARDRLVTTRDWLVTARDRLVTRGRPLLTRGRLRRPGLGQAVGSLERMMHVGRVLTPEVRWARGVGCLGGARAEWDQLFSRAEPVTGEANDVAWSRTGVRVRGVAALVRTGARAGGAAAFARLARFDVFEISAVPIQPFQTFRRRCSTMTSSRGGSIPI